MWKLGQRSLQGTARYSGALLKALHFFCQHKIFFSYVLGPLVNCYMTGWLKNNTFKTPKQDFENEEDMIQSDIKS